MPDVAVPSTGADPSSDADPAAVETTEPLPHQDVGRSDMEKQPAVPDEGDGTNVITTDGSSLSTKPKIGAKPDATHPAPPLKLEGATWLPPVPNTPQRQ
jgi:hypothetical protein